ncbi:hypothetical protein FANTH_14011 [Fusarium anthophilum]|uniref:Uncharacterized protein n=1 Tax=Fusarium anthophilum TaxID=48485 RepID=A0A8H4YL00_9HYPO|nr:hypothetical protein FANTH_14011 [Fusarium anthophilum]
MSGSSIYRGCGNLSVGSFVQFDSKLPPSHDRVRQHTHESTWVKLAEAVPKDEEGWRLARQKHAFSAAAEMVKTLEDLLDGKKKSQLYKTVYLASRYAILRGDSSQKKTVYPYLRKCLDSPTLKYDMLDRYMDSVVKLVKALDDLFLKGLLHRAFELVLYNKFVTFFSIQKPPVEIQGPLLFSIPFLVHRLFPELSPAEYCIFESTIQDRNVLPRLLLWPIEVFRMPQSLPSATSKLTTELRGYNPMPPHVPSSTRMYCYQWPDDKDRLTGVLWEILTSQNLLKEEEHRLSKPYAIRHDKGHLPTPDNHVQVLIPVVDSTVAVSQVSLDLVLHDRKWRPRWEAGQWILMKPSTFFLPEQPNKMLEEKPGCFCFTTVAVKKIIDDTIPKSWREARKRYNYEMW